VTDRGRRRAHRPQAIQKGATMIRTKAREGITGLVQALKGRWSSSHRWLRETVVWADADSSPASDTDSSLVDAVEREHEADSCAWQDTETHAFFADSAVALPLDHLRTMDRYPALDYSTSVIEPGGTADARLSDAVEVRGLYTVGDPRSLIVVGTLRSAAIGPVCAVRVAHWVDETPSRTSTPSSGSCASSDASTAASSCASSKAATAAFARRPSLTMRGGWASTRRITRASRRFSVLRPIRTVTSTAAIRRR
jgi:hypothetical protein